MTPSEKIKEDEEYLDKEFPKGKTKFRGQAMVLLALARHQREKEILEIIDKEAVFPAYQDFKNPAEAIAQFKIKLNRKIKGEK